MNIYVYPIKQWGERSLQIQRECEDGYCWEYSEQGLANYLEENGYKVQDITWQVDAGADYATIKARTVRGLFRQLQQLKLQW